MISGGQNLNYRELRSKIINDAAKANIPVLGEFELTSHCNLACKMCYVADNSTKDLSTKEWKKIFFDAFNSGLLFALLTGGEIFVRKDFIELYNYLYDLGVRITLFTNGMFISDEIIETLKKRPPEYLAITVYGGTNETYELITCDKTGFTKLNNTLDKLIRNQINTIIRTIPLKPIFNEIDLIINWSKTRNLKLYHAQYIGPTRTGEFLHEGLRLEPKDLLTFTRKIEEAFGIESKTTETTSVDYKTCAALRSGYFINYEGLMMPCAMAYKPAKSVLGEESLLEVFQTLGKELKNLEADIECLTCKYNNACIQCYARRMLEGNSHTCASYLKEYAKVKGAFKI